MKPYFLTFSRNANLCLMGLALLLALPAVLAQTPPKAQQFTLKNGMTLIIKVD